MKIYVSAFLIAIVTSALPPCDSQFNYAEEPTIVSQQVGDLIGEVSLEVFPTTPLRDHKISVDIVGLAANDQITTYYTWEFSEGIEAEFIEDKSRAWLWCTPGPHTVTVRIICIHYDAKEMNTTEIVSKFTVVDKLTPIPFTDYCQLVTQEEAAKLRGIYKGQSSVVSNQTKLTRAKFQTTHDAQLRIAGLEQHGASKQVQGRLEELFNSINDPFTKDGIDSLSAVLLNLSGEFSCSGPPVIEHGQRVVVIVAESTNPPLWQVSLINHLRSGDGAEYLEENQHTLYILDPDSELPSGEKDPMIAKLENNPAFTSLPSIFVLDESGTDILGSDTLQESGDKVIKYIQSNGG